MEWYRRGLDGEERVAEIDAEKTTTRLEAFSDGIFSVAITLLVLDLKVPRETAGEAGLGRSLLLQWPTYAAYAISFATVLVMWVNHHRLFRVISVTDHVLLLLNGLLLMFITLVPFSTSLLADHIRGGSARLASICYCAEFEMVAIAFNLLWRYARGGDRLLDPRADRGLVAAIDAQYRPGPLFYLAAMAACFISPWLGFAACSALAVFFALPMGRAAPSRPA